MDNQKLRLCLGCMEMIPADEPFCHLCGFNAVQYQGNPRCLRLGQKLADKYIVGKVIGEGGFGITYIGWDTVLEMPVAIKEYFPSNIASRDTSYGANTINIFDGKSKEVYEQGLQRYVKEAKNLSKFHYLQGIVSVRDFFYANATAYIVMEYINGITMKEHMKKVGRIKPAQVFESLRPIMESLIKIHEKGIVHRDISPDNIMIAKNGTIKLIDFGSARLTENGEKSLTVMLKRGFAPEEQYRSKGNQGPWTDVYALCATMYYMMAGKVPPEAMERLLTDEIIPLDTMGLPITAAQAAAVHKGLAVRAADRFQSVGELMNALFAPGTAAASSSTIQTGVVQNKPAPAGVNIPEAKSLDELGEMSVTVLMPENQDEDDLMETQLLPEESALQRAAMQKPTSQESTSQESAMQKEPASHAEASVQHSAVMQNNPELKKAAPIQKDSTLPKGPAIEAKPDMQQKPAMQQEPFSIVKKEVQSANAANVYQASDGDDLFALLNDYREDKTDYMGQAAKRRKIITLAVCGLAVILIIGGIIRSQSERKDAQQVARNTTTSTSTSGSTGSDDGRLNGGEEPEETVEPTATPVPTYTIPNVEKKKFSKVKKDLKKLDADQLEIKVKYAYSTKIKKGYVIKQSIKKGKSFAVDEEVSLTLTVSKGEQLYKVPKVTGKSNSAAVSKLKAKKLKVNISYAYSDTVAKGKVISQSIKAGKKVKKGTNIRIVISNGKRPQVQPTATPAPSSSTSSSGSTATKTPSPTKKPSSSGNKWNNLDDGSGW